MFRVNYICNFIHLNYNIIIFFSILIFTKLFSHKGIITYRHPKAFMFLLVFIQYSPRFYLFTLCWEIIIDNLKSRHKRIKLHSALVCRTTPNSLSTFCLPFFPLCLPSSPIFPIHQMEVISLRSTLRGTTAAKLSVTVYFAVTGVYCAWLFKWVKSFTKYRTKKELLNCLHI